MEHMGMVWFLKQIPSQTEGSEKRGFVPNSGATDDAPMGMYYSQWNVQSLFREKSNLWSRVVVLTTILDSPHIFHEYLGKFASTIPFLSHVFPRRQRQPTSEQQALDAATQTQCIWVRSLKMVASI